MSLTADTITDAQIRALLESTKDAKVRIQCKLALNDGVTYLRADVVRKARGRCAEILNQAEKA